MDKNTINKIFKYWLKGITSKDIALLVGISSKSVRRVIKAKDFKNSIEFTPLPVRAYQLKQKGLSFTEIAKTLKICRSTAFTYVKEQRKLKK